MESELNLTPLQITVRPQDSQTTIDPNTPANSVVSIDPGGLGAAPVPQDVADKRAAKTVFGFDQDTLGSKSHPEIASNIAAGGETGLRSDLAVKTDQNRQEEFHKNIFDMANKGPLNIEAVKALSDKYTKPSNPDSIIEDQFAVKYINSIFKAGKLGDETNYTWLDSALAEIPEQVKDVFGKASSAVSKYQFALKQEQDLEAEVQAQSWPTYIKDLAHTSIPGISSAYLRGRDIPFFSEGFLGQHLEAERQALYRLPDEEYKARLTQILTRLKEENPHLALRFAQAMRGQTQDESAINSQFELLDISALPGIAKGAASLARKAELYNQTNVAARKMITGVTDMDNLKVVNRDGETVFDSSGNPVVKPAEPVSVVVPTMTGDLGEAAVQKSTATLIGKLGGTHDPAKEAVEALTSNFRVDKQTNITNPGRYGQEGAIRLNAQIDANMGKIAEAIDNDFKVNRTPALLASEAQVRQYKAKLEGLHRGIDNAILDISDPIYNEATNTHHFELYIGTPDGDLFPSKETALANAKRNGYVVQPIGTQQVNTINQQVGTINKLIKDREAKLKIAEENAADEELTNKVRKYNEKRAVELRQELERHRSKIDELRVQRKDFLAKSEGRSLKSPAFGEQGATIEQHGVGFYIRIPTKQLNETDKLVRDGLITLRHTSAAEYKTAVKRGDISTSLPPSWFGGWINATLGFGRTPEDTLSITENAMRKIATHGPSVLLQTVKDIAKPITNLATHAQDANKLILRKNWDQFDRFIRFGQKDIEPTTGTPGRFFTTPEMSDFYMRNYGRWPEIGEVEAYQAYKHLTEFTRILRSIADYKNKARMGAESHSIYTVDGQGNKIASDFFDGVTQPDFPHGDGVVMVVGDRPNTEKLYRANSPKISSGSKEGQSLREAVKQGQMKVIQIFNTERNPLRDYSKKIRNANAYPQFVIVRAGNVETKPIAWDSAPRKAAGDMVPKYSHYVKLPDIQTENVEKIVNRYHGDITLAGVRNATEGNEIAARWNEFHALIRAGDENAARAFSEKHFDIGGEKHLSWYKPTTGPNGEVISPWLNANHTVRVVREGEQIIDLDRALQNKFEYRTATGVPETTFFDATKFGSLARRTQEEMYGHHDARELFTLQERGTNAQPFYNYEPADLIDPMTAINRGLNKIINDSYMNDIKISSAEHWVQQAAPWLDATAAQLEASPMYYFFHGTFKPGSLGKSEVLTLIGNRKKIRDFIGVPTTGDNVLHWVTQAAAEAVFKGTKVDIRPLTELHLIRDPTTFLRNMAVHPKLGFFNISQILTQGASFANAVAISPRHGFTAVTATTLLPWYHLSARTPGILDMLDKMASKVIVPGMARFRPGEFSEMLQGYYNSGFINVGREHMMRDDPFGNKIIRSGTDQFLDMGMLPFKIGSMAARTGAWSVAYTEAREANPTGKFGPKEWSQILARASLLDMNQSRASNSIVHTGALSLPMTFYTYPLRVAELMLSKRLGVMEKARLFGWNALMYGVPVGGLGLLGFPIADYLRKKAIDNGYIVGENTFYSIFMDGLSSYIGAAITGGGDSHKGTWFNTGRFATKGIDLVSDIVDQDKSFRDVALGAPGDILKKGIENSSGLRMWMGSMWRMDEPNSPKAFKLQPEHIYKVFREITTLDKSLTAAAAINTGIWANKNGVKMDTDVSPLRAIFMAATGLTPVEMSDTHLKKDLMTQRRELQEVGIKGYLEEFQKGINADAIKDHEQAIDYFQNAFAYLEVGKVPEDRMEEVNRRLFRGNETFVNNTDTSFYTRNLPNAEKFERLLQLQRQAIMEKKRRE